MIDIRCRKCDVKFTRNRRQERLCVTCKPNRQKARSAAHAALGVPDGRRFNVPPVRRKLAAKWPGSDRRLQELEPADLARRVHACQEWMSSTGRKAREFPHYQDMTPREVSVAIGWVPWPKGWPA